STLMRYHHGITSIFSPRSYLPLLSRRVNKLMVGCPLMADETSESGDAGKVEVAERHRRHEKLAGFGRDRFSRVCEGRDPVEDSQRALVKSKVLHRRHDRSVLDEKRAISRHTGQGEIGRIDRPDVPEVRHEDGALRALDQLLEGRQGRSSS